MFKKTVMVLLLAGLLLGMVSLGVEAESIRVLVRPDEGDVVQLYASEFYEETGIEVEVDFAGWDVVTDRITSVLLDEGAGFDVIFLPSADKARFAELGNFINLSPWFTELEQELFLEAIFDHYHHEGEMIAVPWYSGGAHFVYNKAYLDAAGIDPDDIRTWEDLLSVSGDIVDNSPAEYAYIPSAQYPGNHYFNFYTMVIAMGGEMFDEDDNPVFNEGVAVEALELLVEGVETGVFDSAGVSMDDYETLRAFQAGITAFMLNSTWSANQAMNPEESAVADDARIMMIPGSADKDTGGLIYAGGFGVVEASQNKDAAVEFIKLLTGTEAQMLHAIEGYNLSTHERLFSGVRERAINKGWGQYGQLIQQVEVGEFAVDAGWLDDYRRIMATAVQDALAGAKTPQEALDWAADEVYQIID